MLLTSEEPRPAPWQDDANDPARIPRGPCPSRVVGHRAKIWLATVSTVVGVATGMFSLRDQVFPSEAGRPAGWNTPTSRDEHQVGRICDEVDANHRLRAHEDSKLRSGLVGAKTTLTQRNALLDPCEDDGPRRPRAGGVQRARAAEGARPRPPRGARDACRPGRSGRRSRVLAPGCGSRCTGSVARTGERLRRLEPAERRQRVAVAGHRPTPGSSSALRWVSVVFAPTRPLLSFESSCARRRSLALTTLTQRNALLDPVRRTMARDGHALAAFSGLEPPKALAPVRRDTQLAWNRNLARVRDYAVRLDRNVPGPVEADGAGVLALRSRFQASWVADRGERLRRLEPADPPSAWPCRGPSS